MSKFEALKTDFEFLLEKTAQLESLLGKTQKTEADLRRNVLFMKHKFEDVSGATEAEQTFKANCSNPNQIEEDEMMLVPTVFNVPAATEAH